MSPSVLPCRQCRLVIFISLSMGQPCVFQCSYCFVKSRKILLPWTPNSLSPENLSFAFCFVHFIKLIMQSTFFNYSLKSPQLPGLFPECWMARGYSFPQISLSKILVSLPCVSHCPRHLWSYSVAWNYFQWMPCNTNAFPSVWTQKQAVSRHPNSRFSVDYLTSV